MANKRIWDYLGAASHTKDTSVLDDPDFDKQYEPFLINRAFSQHEDSVLAAQMVNERPDMPKKHQFLFYLNTLRARKRFGDWLKFTVSDDAKAVAEYYGIPVHQARPLVSLHTPEQMAIVHRRLDKGGTTNKRVQSNGSKS